MSRFIRIMRNLLVLALVAVVLPISIPAASTHAAGERTLTILHTANTYNHIQEFKPFKQGPQGGAARQAAIIKQVRSTHPNTILLSAGNDVMGTPMFAQYGGVASGEVMSRLTYNAALANQMDLMAGGTIEGFKGYQSVVNYALVNSNLDLSSLSGVNVPSNTVLNVNGLKVGVFGLSNERAISLANFGQSITARDTDKAIQDNLDEFAKQGVDIVVLLSSMGVDRDKQVAAKYGGKNGIDVIVGNAGAAVAGDPADLAPNTKPLGPYPIMVNEKTAPVALVYAGQFGTYMGELDVTFDDNGILTGWNGKPHFLNDKVTPDPDMQKYVDGLAAGIVMNKIVIGQSPTELYGSFQDYPWRENPLANLFADAFLEFGRPFGAQIALANSGSVWSTFNAGNMTLADLYRVQPFTNWLIIMDLKGSQLEAVLENGVSRVGEGAIQGAGRFIAPAGLTYTYDLSKPKGSRITEVLVDGKPLDLSATYTVAVNDFMANGGDDFSMLRQGSNVFNTGISITDLLQQYIQAHSPITAPELGRITAANVEGL